MEAGALLEQGVGARHPTVLRVLQGEALSALLRQNLGCQQQQVEVSQWGSRSRSRLGSGGVGQSVGTLRSRSRLGSGGGL